VNQRKPSSLFKGFNIRFLSGTSKFITCTKNFKA